MNKIRYAIMAIVFLFISTSNFVYANGVLGSSDVDKFKFGCWPNSNYDISLDFAPVRKLPKEDVLEGQWSYEYISSDRQYKDGVIKLSKKGAVRVDLVSKLEQSNSSIEESYLWHVIVAPKVDGWGFGGHWPTKKPITEYERLGSKRESLVNLAVLSTHEGQPVHTTIESKDIDNAGTLNKAWVDIFGEKIVSNLVYPSSKGSKTGKEGYSLTFYYVPTPALRLISQNGHRWPSFKHIDKPGKVYGFVLTPKGECLAWDSVDVIR